MSGVFRRFFHSLSDVTSIVISFSWSTMIGLIAAIIAEALR
jgi:hypothetical protein